MRIDMSAEAVTARLKLVSELRRLCLSLGTAQIRTKPLVETPECENRERVSKAPVQQRK
jgi:hypothetical protein